jgi:hypothetical protein
MINTSHYTSRRRTMIGSMFSRIHMFAAVLAIALAGFSLAAVQPAFANSTYGADDNYILVKSCTAAHCAANADWAPYVQQLHEQFTREGWGRDLAVVSRNPGPTTPWGAWAADHLYYVDGTNQRLIQAELSVLYHELRGSAALHIIRVPVVQ